MRRLWILPLLLLPAKALAQESEDGGAQVVLHQHQFAVRVDAISFARSEGFFDADGDRQPYDDQYTVPGLLEAKDFRYDAAVLGVEAAFGILDGLEAGVGFPFVRNRVEGRLVPIVGPTQDFEQEGSGLGDVSVFVSGEFPARSVSAGGTIYAKLPTGKATDLDQDEMAIGSGQTDIGVVGFFRLPGRVQVDGRGGFVLRLAGERGDPLGSGQNQKYDPGDILFFDAGATYFASDTVGVGGALLYYAAGQERAEDANGDLQSVDDSQQSQLSIAPHVIVRLNDNLSFNVSTRIRRIGSGRSRLDTGIAITGRNDGYTSIPPITVGAELRFP